MNLFELRVLDALTSAVSNPVLDRVMVLISTLGNSGWIWIALAALMLCVGRYRKAGVTLAVALVTDLALVNGIIKPLVDRTRPFVLNPDALLLISPPKDGSFPSGHTAASFAAASVIYHFNKRCGVAAYVFATLMALSRLYLYVHYPTDVLGGIIIGILIGIFAVWLVGALARYRQADSQQDNLQKKAG